MSLRLTRRSARRRAGVDAALAAYVEWRSACDVVRDAYRQWAMTGSADKPFAFELYQEALDREESAATAYCRLMRRVADPAQIGLVRQLARIDATTHLGCR
jgi:hypothetical protein